MIETDSPYITPVPYRGKRNEPAYVKYVAEKIAEIRNITFDEVISMTSRTAKNLFRLAIMIFALNSFSLFAQEIPDEEFYDDDEVYYEYDGFASKGLGFGFTVASFTVVDSFKPEGDEVTYEGQLGLGGFVGYSLFDWLHLEMSYIYAENTDIQEEFANVPEPNTYRFVEASALWMPNPHQRVNFYGITGVSFLRETFWQPEGASGTIETNSALGINGGLGFNINIKFESLGVLTVSGEWKVNFIPELKTYNNDPRGGDKQGSVDFSTFYSIPRLKVTYYPKWLDFKAK